MDTETLKRVRDSLAVSKKQIDDLTIDVNNAQRAGVDVSQHVKDLQDLTMRYRKMLAVYGG